MVVVWHEECDTSFIRVVVLCFLVRCYSDLGV